MGFLHGVASGDPRSGWAGLSSDPVAEQLVMTVCVHHLDFVLWAKVTNHQFKDAHAQCAGAAARCDSLQCSVIKPMCATGHVQAQP